MKILKKTLQKKVDKDSWKVDKRYLQCLCSGGLEPTSCEYVILTDFVIQFQ